MRLQRIQTYAAANDFLEKEYLPEHNRRFARLPAKPEDFHRPAPCKKELEEVFHLESERVISNDWVVRHDNRYFQIQRQAMCYAPAKGRVKVCEWEDGRLQIRYRGRAVAWKEVAAPVPAAARTMTPAQTPQKASPQKANHPWRQDYRKMRPWRPPGTPLALRMVTGATPSASA
jgi:hypothetical protein